MEEIKITAAQIRRNTKRFRKAAASALAAVLITFLGISPAVAEAKILVPVGRAVGIKLASDGVMIVGIPDTCSDGETPSPSKSAGFKAGDIITRLGKTAISSGEELKKAMGRQDGRAVSVQVRRGGETAQFDITPHKIKSGEYSLGLWVRDGISGIGTITFYDPETGAYGALGHSVNDGETGVMMPVREGAISRISVTDVAKGKSGTPGQLHGAFDFEDKLGTITSNTGCGIFGTASPGAMGGGAVMEAAEESEIHTGEAYILSNVAGSEVRKYSAEISRVFTGREADGRSMLVTVTDPALTEATGGIVQGMSGSPIIQDGKLIGAVTHVLVNDPSKGYAVSITRMLESAGIGKSALAA
ncbi:MAG: SpoIVB peptidase [Oscillospiraceae bacterium]|jgi:stage IV sporulation protein B|nr:SpoIVB peptidase [Oscillospiraceae bacterium]